jgi:hypothetical protein
MNEKRRKKDSFMPAFAVCLFACFMLFFFAPLDTYFSNFNELLFQLSDIWPIFILVFAIMFIVFLIGFAILRNFKTVYRVAIALVFGLALAAYAQGNFLNMNKPFLDGNTPYWLFENSTIYTNLAIWGGLVILSFLLAFAFKGVKKHYYTIVKVLSFAMTAILAVTLVTMTIAMPKTDAAQRAADQYFNYYLTTENRFELSEEHNLVVFWLDSVETALIDQAMENDPEYLAEFDGFTFYHNMSGSYRKTDGVYAYLLSGQYYLNQEPFPVFAQNAINQDTLFSEIKEQGYHTHIREFGHGIPYSEAQMSYFDNLEKGYPQIKSKKFLTKHMLLLTAYRYAPVIMKPLFFEDYTTKLSVDNITIEFDKPVSFVEQDADYEFYDTLKQEGLTIQDDYKCFKFYMLRAGHGPIDMNEKTEKVERNSVTIYQQTLGTLNILNEYLKQMKELGVYDDATIIIMADHGEGWVTAPVFMMKNPKEQGEIKISHATVSHEDIRATLIQAAGGDYRPYGTPVSMWPEHIERERMFYAYEYQFNVGFDYYFNDITEYLVPMDANDYDQYVPSGNIYEKP